MRPTGPVSDVDGRRVAAMEPNHVLAWGDGWHVVGDHIEMRPSALERLEAGHKPGRKDWMNEARTELTRAVRRYAPALCPKCGTLNEIDPKPLDVNGIAAY